MSAEDWLVRDQRRRVAAAEETLLWIRALAAVNSAVHELQRERGLSSSYLASSGRQFEKELTFQHQRTDRFLVEADEALGATDRARWPVALSTVWTTAWEQLHERPSIRQLVQTLEFTAAQVPEAYSMLIQGLLEASEAALETWPEPDLVGWTAQAPLQRWKETFGQERAWGALLMAGQTVPGHTETAHGSLAYRRVTRQTWEGTFFRVASGELAARARSLLVSVEFQKREALLERLLAPGTLPVSMSLFSWYEAASAVMEELRALDNALSQSLAAQQEHRLSQVESEWSELVEAWGRLGKRLQRRLGTNEGDSPPGTPERRLTREVERRRALQPMTERNR